LKQADVEVDFELTSIDSADPFDPSWLLDVEKHCRESGASVQGGIGPFGLVVLASDNMEEHTVVHFRVYKSHQSYMVLMCSDLRRLVLMVSASISLIILHLLFLSETKNNNLHRSSLRSELYTPAYGGFFEVDLERESKISLRTLVGCRFCHFSFY
jgi:beta-fructofuranosidase